MLSYALAIAVALSSLVLFSTAFLMSDIHRQDDFLWSGVGLIYALVLWFCHRNITGAVLLGQAAAAALIVSYNWQTLRLRKAIANPEKADEVNNFSVLQAVNGLLKPSSQKNLSSSVQQNKSGLLGKLFGNKKKAAITNTKLDEVLEEKVTDKAAIKNTSSTTPTTEEKPVVPEAETPVKETPDGATKVTKLEAKQPTETKENEPENETAIVEDRQENQSTSIVSETIPAESSPATKENELEQKVVIQDNEVDTSPSPEVPQTSQSEETSTETSEKEQTSESQNQPEIVENNNAEVKEVKEESEKIEPEKEESPLDSLETVEVAEVLEAVPEDLFAQQEEDDRSNIIEVSTTEINIVTESTKIDHNQDKNSESKD